MQNQPIHQTYSLNPQLNIDEKILLLNNELQRLFTHFNSKADKAKTNFHFYKYSKYCTWRRLQQLFPALQVIYPTSFPQVDITHCKCRRHRYCCFFRRFQRTKNMDQFKNSEDNSYRQNNFYSINRQAGIIIFQKKKAYGYFQNEGYKYGT